MRLKKPQTKHTAKFNEGEKKKKKTFYVTKAKTINFHESSGS